MFFNLISRLGVIFILLFLTACNSNLDVEFNAFSLVDSLGNLLPPEQITIIDPSANQSIDNTPIVRVDGLINNTVVRLYSDRFCQNEIMRSISESDALDFNVSALPLGVHYFYATQETEALNRSVCSTAFDSYEVIRAPNAPLNLVLINPASSPGTVATPTIRISGVASGNIVRLFTDSSCSSEVSNGIATGASINLVSQALAAGVYNFYASQTSRVAGSSSCSTATVAYEYVVPLPAPTTLTLQNPSTSPGIDPTPTIRVGGVLSGERVRLYANNTCSVQVANGVASGASINLTSLALTSGVYNFYATRETSALNRSNCSVATVQYQLISVLAAPTTLTLQDPTSSPGIDPTPTIRIGGVLNAETIRLYTNNTCTIQVATGVASATNIDLTSPALAAGTYNFYATRETSALDRSSCSTATVQYAYTPVLSAPTTLTLQNPSTSPGIDSTPTIRVGGVLNGETVRLYTNNTCTVQVSSSVSSGASVDLTSSALAAGTYNFYATRETNAVNRSNCSFATVRYELIPVLAEPTALTLQNPATSPGTDSTPTIRVSGVLNGETVRLYRNNTCTTEVASGVASAASIDLTSSALSQGTYNFYATRESSALNRSNCSTATVRYVYANNPMILVFRTSSANQSVTLPLPSGYTYNFTVNWGDGSPIDTVTSNSSSHVYSSAGSYTVNILGTLQGFSFGDVPASASLITAVTNLGNTGLVYMDHAFMNCSNLRSVSGGNTSGVTSMVEVFRGASSFSSGNISGWNTSNVVNMDSMFMDATSFNLNISNWQTGNVTNMQDLFTRARVFNQPIGSWNVSQVVNMRATFFIAEAFNQPLNSWQVGNVTDMRHMFWSADSFNQDLNSWDVRRVVNMYGMFYLNRVFDGNISSWNTRSLEVMGRMFALALRFNQNLSSWNTSNVTNRNLYDSSANRWQNSNKPNF